ncbi:ribosomal RNA small subunit methyltransferase A [Saccharomonospora glauca]|jgi:23S rRNA (adenine-N6)-dimethyltransferase|uniref:Dimethyladenosine transferase (RRNA methylation) n=1 Tax=Saccharomonospora glauca K62 TaxID=928724 RepID=I1D590_9PSEU|nr:rRNA adenine dimethyltransferase family protein [Saccharomonospora glauca]EIF00115.1 dimethyladenosine transferase (rRNA methylation) [Saccharomonospora glauca K62]
MSRNRRIPRHGLRPNPSGVHFLVAEDVVRTLVRTCEPGPHELVVDFGAGPGVMTAAVARTGARVLAVERDPEFVATLERRFRHTDRVRVIHGDLRTVALPRKDFLVVSNPPYSTSTALLRRLLGPRRPSLTRAALTVEWGFARRLVTATSASRELAWWTGRFDVELIRRVRPDCFRPQPTVDSAVIAIRRRRLSPAAERLLIDLLDAASREPSRSARALVRHTGIPAAHRLLSRCGLEPGFRAGAVTPRVWATFAEVATARRE